MTLQTAKQIMDNAGCRALQRAGQRPQYARGRANLMTGRQRAAPALARSSGGSSVQRSLRGRHSRWFRKRMLLRSFSSQAFITLELHHPKANLLSKLAQDLHVCFLHVVQPRARYQV